MSIVVDLPAPFGPSRATVSPGEIVTSTPRTACTGPWGLRKVLVRPSSVIAGALSFLALTCGDTRHGVGKGDRRSSASRRRAAAAVRRQRRALTGARRAAGADRFTAGGDGRRRVRRVDVRQRRERGRLRSVPPHRAIRPPRQPAGLAAGTVGLELVSGDREVGLRARPAGADHVLPAVSADDPGPRLRGPLGPRGRRSHLAGVLRDRPVAAVSPDRARVRRRAGARMRDADRVLPDGLLLLGRLHGVAVPGAVRWLHLPGPARALGMGRRARGAGGGVAQHRGRADRADRPHVPVRATGRSRAVAPAAWSLALPVAAAVPARTGSRVGAAGPGRAAGLPAVPGSLNRRRPDPVSRGAAVVPPLRRTVRRHVGRRCRRLGRSAPAAPRPGAARLLQGRWRRPADVWPART